MRCRVKFQLEWVCVVLLWVSGCQVQKKDQSLPEQPNILFILVDDMGWRDTGTYGSTFYETPNIDTLANQGIKFTDAYAPAPICSPSRYAIQTGRYPADIHLTDWIPGTQFWQGAQPWQKLVNTSNKQFMPLSEVTLAEVLKGVGYKTFFAGKWHLSEAGNISKDSLYWPENQGYDINKGGWSAGSPSAHGGGGYFSPYQNPRLKDGPKGEYLPDRLTNETIRFMKNESGREAPFFAFLAFYNVHTPLQSRPGLIAKYKKKAAEQGLDTMKTYIRDKWWMKYSKNFRERIVQSNPIYASMVESVDQNVGRLMNTLQANSLAKNTIVVFFSDNGGQYLRPTSNLPLRLGKGWLYEGGIREPLIIRWPQKIKAGAVSHIPVSGIDFYPTLLEMAGIHVNTTQIDGKSIAPILNGKNPGVLKERPLFWHYPHYHGGGGRPSSAVRKGNYKLIKFWEDNHIELYNLKKDIGEQHDLAKEQPQKAQKLEQLLTQWLDSTKVRMPQKNPSYDPDFVPGKGQE